MVSKLVARWTPLALSSPGANLSSALVRSSNSVAVVGTNAYIFGGELQPRTPVGSDLTIVDLTTGEQRVLSPTGPAPRVGASLVASGGNVYLWGGRGGKDMGVFGEGEDLWKLDLGTHQWEAIATTGDKPEQRSFHVMAAIKDTLFLHAGCPPKGRLATLHSLDLPSLTWSALPTAPGPGRGGTVLCPLSDGSLVRFGGFAGFELGGPLDVYSPSTKAWTSEEIEVLGGGEGPEKRSVHALVRLEGGLEFDGRKVVAVMALGEREGAPAELGHDGAGFFHDDAWALLHSAESSKFSWMRLAAAAGSTPEARGWFGASFWEGNKIVIQGGLNERNERLGDGWVLEVALE